MIDPIPPLPLTPHLTEQELNDLLDGRVPRDDRRRLEEHLDACGRCRTLHDDLRSLLALARASRHTAVPPEELWSLVSACTVHERAVRRQLVRSARTPIAGMALVVATLSATAGAVAARAPRRGVATEASTERAADAPPTTVPNEPMVSDAPTSAPAEHQAEPSAEVAAAAVAHHASGDDSLLTAPLPSDVGELRERAGAIDVRIRSAVREAAGQPADSPAYAHLADLYAVRRSVMEAIRSARK